MENTNVSIEKEEESKTVVVEPVIEETPKIMEEQVTPNEEPTTTEDTSSSEKIESTTENVEKKEDEDVSPSTSEKPIDEQENVIDTNPTVPSATVSPGRANVPLKEVNETETMPNGTENTISKKRELDQEDEQPEENIKDNEERMIDQTKKMKTNDSTDTPIIETKETENNHMGNGTTTTAVEV